MYKDVNEIETKKEELRKEIARKEDEISRYWRTLFNPPKESTIETPTQRMMHYAHTAAGVFDGALLGWKLYRKLNGSFSFGRRKKK